jgi:hypothetical protein
MPNISHGLICQISADKYLEINTWLTHKELIAKHVLKKVLSFYFQ